MRCGGYGGVAREVIAETIVDDEVVSHTDAVRFHWMAEVVDIVANVGVVVVGHSVGVGSGGERCRVERGESGSTGS